MNYIQRSESVKGSELPITNMIGYSTQLTHYFPLEINDFRSVALSFVRDSGKQGNAVELPVWWGSFSFWNKKAPV